MGTDNAPGGVLVLGMHRSGTSAVAGYLAKAGFFAGDDSDLLPAAEDNPRGFFERTDVNELNDGVLEELGGSWDNPPPREVVAAKAGAYTEDVKALLGTLHAQSEGRPIVLKDPRISLLLPAWLPAVEGHFSMLIVDRPPVEVAQSVRKRDGRPFHVALALWQLYCTELAQGLAGHEVLVVRYQDFVADPAQRGPWLLDQVGRALPAEAMAAASQGPASGFVSSDMRHHRQGTGANPDQLLTVAQAALAHWLGDLPEGWGELPDPGPLGEQPEAALVAAAEYWAAQGDRAGMEAAYDVERHRALHFEQATELKDHHIEGLEEELGKQMALAEERLARVNELDQEAKGLRLANDELRAQLRQLQARRWGVVSDLLGASGKGRPGAPAH